MSAHFPLPRASQQCYTKWYNFTVKSGALRNKTILWAAEQLPCRFRSEQVKDIIGPQHVFILTLSKQFYYALIDSTSTVYRLPKKYFTSCFPAIQYRQVPKDNRCKVKLSNRNSVVLPYIPESFLEQKKNKSTRKRRRTETTGNNMEAIDFNEDVPEWSILNNGTRVSSNKEQLFHLIRSIIDFNDTNQNFELTNPFEDKTIEQVHGDERLKEKLKIVISFIYFYCRDEVGCFRRRDMMPSSELQTWIANLQS